MTVENYMVCCKFFDWLFGIGCKFCTLITL